ncbi:Transmembrane transcriptional regulator (anti-sigma factor RsiW) [Evansella caseinilytica]|uniref:Anti-sigma-W factor RsiW n=1 Tax=Evansella caseinilytica TaxID=1503961 RepID=A0A1H3SIU1_9BACI|nr:zf-HC2 domain-containing protein [Evansella caseinilytica]SDZ37647.1 Transmembrane transcriptional regulator (anti-sigma factor RsiW) [Evansella caseinilytica]
MACSSDDKRLIHKYLDEEVTLLEKKQLESHITKCPECEEQLQELRKTVAIIQSASHMKAPDDFTDNVMSRLPKQPRSTRWKVWMKKHPYLITAATFFLVFIVSLQSIWNEGNKEIVVKGDGQFIVDKERGVVVIPEGETISGDLVVRNGNIEVEGEVHGDITVINGEWYLASLGQVTGEINEINQMLEWLWYHAKEFFNDVVSIVDNNNGENNDKSE